MTLLGIVLPALLLALAVRRWVAPVSWPLIVLFLGLTLGFLHGAVFSSKLPVPVDEVATGRVGGPRPGGRVRAQHRPARITDATPLTQASQQFNAAAVALEMSWLRMFADAGCLTDDQQKQAEAAVRDYTAALQKSLKDAGYYDGKVDGVYGPATVDAVEPSRTPTACPPPTRWTRRPRPPSRRT